MTQLDKCLCYEEAWKDKKILFFITDVIEETLYLNNINIENMNIRLRRDQEISKFCNSIFWRGILFPVEVITEEDVVWAEKIVMLERPAVEKKLKNKFLGCGLVLKLEICKNPFTEVERIYQTKLGENFHISSKYSYCSEISQNDIPFIMEPRMSRINKNTVSSYFTYSLGKRYLLDGVYFDEQEIAEMKKYAEYNTGTHIIVFGEKIESQNFTEESLVLYRYLYGQENVSYIKDYEDIKLEDETTYLLLRADIRMVSPFIVKFFKSARKGYNVKSMFGLISPDRIYGESSIRVLWGTGAALKQFNRHIPSFTDAVAWYDYVMKNGILAEWEMFNYMDMNKLLIDCADKCNCIGYTEWMLNKGE